MRTISKFVAYPNKVHKVYKQPEFISQKVFLCSRKVFFAKRLDTSPYYILGVSIVFSVINKRRKRKLHPALSLQICAHL